MINVSMTDKNGVTLATAGKYCSQNVKVTPSTDILRKDEQEKSATPSTSSQDITPDAGMALSKVTVNPITPAIVGGLDAKTFAAAAAAAIEGKGVTVPDGTLLDGMASLIESIEAGGGGMKVEVFSITPANEMSAGTYEIGETTITNPHFCVCFDGTQPASNNTDTRKYMGLITYVGCDATLWGNIGSAYNPSNFGLVYIKYATQYSYERYNYGSSIAFNNDIYNGFYVENGKLYSESGISSASGWLYEAGHVYYILLIGE